MPAQNFDTLQIITTTSVAPDVSNIRTAGYSSVGDGGGALYKRVSSEPVHAGKVQSVDGAWWELAENHLNPKQFGARGDFKQISISTLGGTTTVTSYAGTFSPAHVGCQLTIQTGPGTTLRRHIVAYVSNTEVTIDAVISNPYSGASAYLGTLDTDAVNNCFACAVSLNVPVNLTGIHLVGGIIVNQGPITIRGSGPHNSGFVIDVPTERFGIANSGDPYKFPYNGTLLADFSVRSGFEVNTSDALIAYYANMQGSPQRFVMLENINVNTLGSGFHCGISLHNASNYSTRDVQIAGYGPILAGSVGLRVTGDQKPIDMYNTGLKVYFCDTAVQIRGTASFSTVMEAVVFIGCVLIVNNVCIDYQSDTATPYLGVMDSNLNGYKKDIQTLNIVQIKIDNNLFYSADRTPHESTWVGVEISYSNAVELPLKNRTGSGFGLTV